ncbi:MAG: hypothetical protein GDA36_10095 [Rhodobacteraceae bacterium]|nr:hypothetical protein [Paracoccaceae bacterium]
MTFLHPIPDILAPIFGRAAPTALPADCGLTPAQGPGVHAVPPTLA